jgi:hypothetical protein
MILVVRAIFISPAQGSEFGPSPRPSDSSLKRIELIRPTRLRFTKPCPPSPSQERLDCLDGSDGDGDERTSLAEASTEAWFRLVSSRLSLEHRPSNTASARSLVRLRC